MGRLTGEMWGSSSNGIAVLKSCICGDGCRRVLGGLHAWWRRQGGSGELCPGWSWWQKGPEVARMQRIDQSEAA